MFIIIIITIIVIVIITITCRRALCTTSAPCDLCETGKEHLLRVNLDMMMMMMMMMIVDDDDDDDSHDDSDDDDDFKIMEQSFSFFLQQRTWPVEPGVDDDG